MTEVTKRDFRFHLAYNGVTNEVYLVKANGKGFEIVDPNNPDEGTLVEFNISGGTPTGVYYDNNLYIGASNSDTLWKYAFGDGSLTKISAEGAVIPVGGGDLVVTGEKGGLPTFKLATRTNKSFWDLTPDGAGLYTAGSQLTIPKNIMGMCVALDGTILMANKGSQALNVFELSTGVQLEASFELEIGGEPFTIRNGDMAAGCNIESNPEPNDCDDYQMYYADIRNGKTIISSFTLDAAEGTATLGDSFDFDKQMHIAIDPNGGIIYGKAEQDNMLTVLDPIDGTSTEIELTGEVALKSITTNTFHDGKLYLGSASQNRIVEVDLTTNKYVDYATGVPVSGGDIVFRGEDLMLATRAGNQLLKVEAGAGMTSMMKDLGTNKVTGLALTVSGEYIASFEGQSTFQLLDSDGDFQKSFDVKDANGDSLTLKFGDLAAACVFPRIDEPPVGDCEDFRYYYADIKGSDTNVSTVSLAGTTANFVPLHTFKGNKLHISFDTGNGNIYGAGETAGQNLIIYNVITGAETSIPLIDLDTEPKALRKVVTNAYRNGKVYLGSESQKRIVEVDVETGEYRTLATGVPINGGDLIFDGDDLILATRAGQRIIRIETDDLGVAIVDDMSTIASGLTAKVNGMALTSGGDYLLANDGQNAFELFDSNGDPLWSYTVTGLGEDFKFKSGDLASGCYVLATDNLCEAANVSIENGSFEELSDWTISGGWDYVPQVNVPGWETNTNNETIEIQETTRVNGNESSEGGQHFELNGDGLNNLYQRICTNDLDNLRVTFDHKKRQQGGVDEMELYVVADITTDITPENARQIISIWNPTKTAWETKSWVFDIPNGQEYTYIYFKSVSGTNNTIGNLIDNVSVESTFIMPTTAEEFASTLGTTEVAVIENDIRMYPVPANNEINVTLNSSVGGSVSYEIVSIMGQSFNRGSVEAYSGETNIKADISNLADGTYFFVMNVNGNTITKQFVKMRR
jgi:hypothetical protein